jgi:hypothetical protein
MNTHTRTPLRAPSRPEAVSAGGASSAARAQIPPRGKPRNHGDEIANLLAERDETTLYPCLDERARHAEGQISDLMLPVNDAAEWERRAKPNWWDRASLAVLIALALTGLWLIGGML